MGYRHTEICDTLEQHWAGRDVALDDLAFDDKGTIVPRPRAKSHPGELPTLPCLLGRNGREQPHLTLRRRELGRGASGVVRVASQLSLQRDVAVKCLINSEADVRERFQMLREARVVGALEHPNVVPVYMLGSDEQGLPVLVMKQITGTRWSDLMDDPSALRTREQVRDPLLWHIEVLKQVCNAVHYAHKKRILHRDLKPENVMIGEFGEVYVLDWGLAVSTDPDNAIGLDHVGEIDGVAGTPAYMAPELVAIDNAHIDERTDVYLLGSILHEIVTGTPRHTGRTMVDTLGAALASKPVSYPASVPPELAGICNRATARDPTERYASAEALRQAIDAFLQHRLSLELSSQADRRLGALRGLVGSEGGLDESVAVDGYRVFGECRFAFEEALRQWPENADARAGLQTLLETMAAHEIAQGNVPAASALIAEMPAPSERLRDALEALRARIAREQAELESLKTLGHQQDKSVGRTVRASVVALMGGIWTVFYLVLGMLSRDGLLRRPHEVFMIVNLAYGCFIVAAMWKWRHTLRETRVNRSFVWALWAAFLAGAFYWGGAWQWGIPFDHAAATTMLMYACIVWMSAAVVDAILAWAALPYVMAFFGVLMAPAYAWDVLGVATLLAMTTAAAVWRPANGNNGNSDRPPGLVASGATR